MWIFTIYGFFSIACAEKNKDTPNHMMIRARDEQHLKNLINKFGLKVPILENAATDYAFRIIVLKSTWLKMLNVLADEQTWSNFKNEAAKHEKTVGWNYISALHRVWNTMLDLQNPMKWLRKKWR